MKPFDSSGGTVPVQRGVGGSVELRVDGVSVAVESGPDEGETALLKGASLSVGTDPTSDLRLTDPTVSRRHLVLSLTPDGILAEDLGTTNGSWVGGVRLRAAIIPAGATLKLGGTVLTVKSSTSRFLVTPAQVASFHGLLGESPAMRNIYGLIQQLARTDLPVNVTGETGTGKELVGRALHLAGPRKDKPFLVLDCGSIMPDLLRSELFGHEKGAFTGADRANKGILEQARGGTVFLDEVGEMGLGVQPQLLRALETRQVTRIGSHAAMDVDFRVVSATNRDLKAMSLDGQFRSDLLYRLSAVTIRLPPLRDRREDIPALARHFVEAYAQRHQVPAPRFSNAALEALAVYAWPGNIRELKNTADALCALAAGATVDVPQVRQILGVERATSPAPTARAAVATPVVAAQVASKLDDMEKQAIATALEQTGWNRRAAARQLGISPTTLLRKIEKFGLKPKSGSFAD